MELMDNHRLPKERAFDILLGVFITNRGKLHPSTPTQPVASTSAAPATPAVSYGAISIPGTSSATTGPAMNTIPMAATAPATEPPAAPVNDFLASLPNPSDTQFASVLGNSFPTTQINQEALVKEIASLTKDQAALLIQHLVQNGAAPPSTAHSVPPPPPASYPAPPVPNFPPQISTTYMPPGQQFAASHYPPLHQPESSFGNSDYDREGQSYSRGERGRRGPGRPRGRPPRSSRGGGLGDAQPRHSDRGWNDRKRGRKPFSPS